MKTALVLRKALRKDKGFALIIVLFFIVLLTALTVAYLARAIIARKVSDSSANQAKAAMLANTAGEVIIGDLIQEMIDGSTATVYVTPNPSGGSVTSTVYTPKGNDVTKSAPGTVTPYLVGFKPTFDTTTGTENDGLANLLKISKSGQPFHPLNASNPNYVDPPSGLQSGRAAAASTTTPSLNGRYVSASRWNSHYLITRDPSATGIDSTPRKDTFVAPDWILMARDGSNPTNAPVSPPTSGAINDPNATNNKYVIGRYAYAIYNEGGLLDMNAAGYPSGLTAAQMGTNKNTVALADLTQLPVTPTIKQQQVDNLVGWRNSYSSGIGSGTFGNVTFGASKASNWMTNFVYYNAIPAANTNNTTLAKLPANGFLSVNTNSLGTATPPTDQAFLSRQQLIKLTQSLNISADALQYLGTFSRSLEQPSYAPDPGRPTILGGGKTPVPPPAASDLGTISYLGNNDAAGNEDSSNPPNPISTPFLSIRVQQSFPRLDGTQAFVGEPLVKKRFALSQLAMVAYNASNASAQTTYKTNSDSNPIYNRFGLTRSTTDASNSAPWVYGHGSTHIKTLTELADPKRTSTTREPDFAELLKAAITTGSLAKGGPNIALSGVKKYNLQYTYDTTTDIQVLQIMANLIDQQDNDSYPTRIAFPITLPDKTTYNYIVSGVEDLPYIYRWHNMSLVDRVPKPPVSQVKDFLQFPGNNAIDGVQSGNTPITISGGKGGTVSGTWRVAANNYQLYGAKQMELKEHRNGSGMPTSSTNYLNDPGEVTQLFVVDLWNPHDPNCLANEDISKRPSQFRVSATTQDPIGKSPQWSISYFPAFQDQGSPQNSNSADVFYGEAVAPPWNQNADANVWTTSGTLPMASFTPTNPNTNTFLTFNDVSGTAFREPTLLWHNTGGINLQGSGGTMSATVVKPAPRDLSATGDGPGTKPSGMPKDGLPDPVGKASNYFGFVAAQFPVSEQITFYSGNGTLNPTFDGVYICQLYKLTLGDPGFNTLPNGGYGQITFTLEYTIDGTTWIPYDWKYPDFSELTPKKTTSPVVIVQASDYPKGVAGWQNMVANKQIANNGSVVDPRTGRWGMQDNINYLTTPTPPTTLAPLDTADATTANFNVLSTQDPGEDKGYSASQSKPGDVGTAATMRWFNVSNFYQGMMAYNNPKLTISGAPLYYEDADGIARRGSGAYNPISSLDATTGIKLPDGSTAPGMPLATANGSYNGVIGSATQQSQSRPFILNRSFHSVEEMGYAFTGTPWKNIDFFTPESGDVALLDTFCVSESPTNGIVAGKVDLNTRQEPVLQALEMATYRDEANNATPTTPPAYSLPPLKTAEATAISQALIKYTTFPTANPTQLAQIGWRGPFANVSELVGKYVATPGTGVATATDVYTYASQTSLPAGNSKPSNTYAGFSATLDPTVFTAASSGDATTATSTTSIQRMREAALRPLVDAGQTRVWNLLIDVVAQTGSYPKTSTSPDNFFVTGEKRIWLHVALDRYTGQVIDKQVEVVAQ